MLLQAGDLDSTKDMVEDYLERHENAFDEFSTPDDAYADILTQLESLDVSQKPSFLDMYRCCSSTLIIIRIRFQSGEYVCIIYHACRILGGHISPMHTLIRSCALMRSQNAKTGGGICEDEMMAGL